MGCCLSTSHSDDRSPYHTANAPTAIPDSRIPILTTPIQSLNPAETVQQDAASVVDERFHARHRAHRFGMSNSGNAYVQNPKSKSFKSAPDPKNVEAPVVSSPGGEPKPASSLRMLHKARSEYFETRVTGRAEMWSVVQTVCGLVEAGSYKDAQAILEAAGGTCPTGILWGNRGGCYDDRGERYVVPAWCVGQPDGIQDDFDDRAPLESDPHDKGAENTLGDAIGGFNRDSKGKGKAVPEQGVVKGKEIKVKVRFSHTARDDVFTIGDQDILELLAQKARQKAAISFDTKLRFVHLGHLMNHNQTLFDSTWQEGQVLSLYVFE